MTMSKSEVRYLRAARNIFTHIAGVVDLRICIRLWDGTVIPMGDDADPEFYISISSAGVLATLLRRPTMENVLYQYATGNIDYHGCELITFYKILRNRGKRSSGIGSKELKKKISKSYILRHALPLFTAPRGDCNRTNEFNGDATGRKQMRDDTSFIRFHYDISNDFYQLFLDPEMIYSCANFTSWEDSLEQAQLHKLEMICRKLRLQSGDRFLDIGCGWGGLVCYAAINFDVQAHGVTLSQKQYDFATAKVKRMGLTDRVTIELRDYNDLDGEYDKISSIGMYEHVGIANYRSYFGKVHSLLRDRGIFLNHGITRRAKHSSRHFKRITPGRKLILKYIFPGSELDHIGHSLEIMESCRFEIHDVEAWREHYGQTTQLWCSRLEENRDKAIAMVGKERYRMWVAYLAGVSFAFIEGSLRIFQTVATKQGKMKSSAMPLTREHLYI